MTEPAVRPFQSDDLVAVVAARPDLVHGARVRFREWIAARGWPDDAAQDMVLAVNEAVTNVVEHAYPPGRPGMCHLHAWVSTAPRTGERRLVATVTDRGNWTERVAPDADRRFRGRGLELMRGLVAQMHVQRSAGGTTIILIGTAVQDVPLRDDDAEGVPSGVGADP
jgi:serine/threonine-protein kinase RsbW